MCRTRSNWYFSITFKKPNSIGIFLVLHLKNQITFKELDSIGIFLVLHFVYCEVLHPHTKGYVSEIRGSRLSVGTLIVI